MDAHLDKARGALAVVGTLIDNTASTALQSMALRDASFAPARPPYHITLLTKDELRSISQEVLDKLQADTRHIFAIGVGGLPKDGVYWVVVVWAAGQQIRKKLGLEPKHFHITLSGSDKHNVDKGLLSLLPNQTISKDAVLLDHLAFTLHCLNQHTLAQEYATQLAELDPQSHKGFLRLADSSLTIKQHKVAMLAFACAYMRTGDPKTRKYCVKKMVECSRETEWGTLCQAEEITQLEPFPGIFNHLTSPWSSDLQQELLENFGTPTLLLEPRQSLYIPFPTKTDGRPQFYKLPRFFRWLVPFRFAIMSTPRNEDDITALASPTLAIRHILTLTEETPLDAKWFQNKDVSNTFLPVPNYKPPSIEQMDLVMTLFDSPKNVPLLVHCGGGKGRAGTIAACYLAAFGFHEPRPDQDHPEMAAADAISALRAMRPGSLETQHQEDFVSSWCSTIWKRQSVYPERPSEPPPCPMEVDGTLDSASNLFLLVGLPGSGKSWFSNSLISRDPANWARISQDDAGSRAFCETEIGRTPRKRVLLDRCNTSSADRRLWLDLASNWCTSPICIWFDYDASICESRAQQRSDHPTLPPGSRVRNAIQQMQKQFVEPGLMEGFSAIVRIRSFQAAEEFLLRLAKPITIFKFPRTPHLIDLGAATDDDIHQDPSSLIPATSSDTQGPTYQVSITEKIDGANMGFSLSFSRSSIVIQNRSHFVNPSSHEQFKKLGVWVERHEEDLRTVLDRDPYFPERYILFGEWMYATHSIAYTKLPDLFIAYDLYDRREGTFVSSDVLREILKPLSIKVVPLLYQGLVMPSREELLAMIQSQSAFRDGRVEGVYVKVGANGVVRARGKIVRGDFIAGNEHWSKGTIKANALVVSPE